MKMIQQHHDMSLPMEFIKTYKELDFNNISIGYTTITLYNLNEFNKISDKLLAIGDEDLCGDQFCIDISKNTLPVYLVPIDNDLEPDFISASFDDFINILRRLKLVAVKRNSPKMLEQNPISDADKQNFINYIILNNPNCEVQFWKSLFEL